MRPLARRAWARSLANSAIARWTAQDTSKPPGRKQWRFLPGRSAPGSTFWPEGPGIDHGPDIPAGAWSLSYSATFASRGKWSSRRYIVPWRFPWSSSWRRRGPH